MLKLIADPPPIQGGKETVEFHMHLKEETLEKVAGD